MLRDLAVDFVHLMKRHDWQSRALGLRPKRFDVLFLHGSGREKFTVPGRAARCTVGRIAESVLWVQHLLEEVELVG